MPRLGVRTGVTYLLVIANIVGALGRPYLGIDAADMQWLQGAGLLALGFFFKGNTNDVPDPSLRVR